MKRHLYLPVGSDIELLELGDDGLYRDSLGTIWALREDGTLKDPDPRCGVGLFSLPESSELNDYCKVHDAMYSIPAYKAYYTRKEADDALKQLLLNADYPIVGKLFYKLCRIFGRFVW